MREDIVAPYAAFPVMMADMKVGVAWLWNMICGPKMQGPYGITESVMTSGRGIAPVLTCDGKMLPILGGFLGRDCVDLMRNALQCFRVYEKFKAIVSNEYEKAFGNVPPEGESLPFRLPSAGIPLAIEDFKPINYSSSQSAAACPF